MLILVRFTSTILGSLFHGALYQDKDSGCKFPWEGMAGEDGGEQRGVSQGLQSEQKARDRIRD